MKTVRTYQYHKVLDTIEELNVTAEDDFVSLRDRIEQAGLHKIGPRTDPTPERYTAMVLSVVRQSTIAGQDIRGYGGGF